MSEHEASGSTALPLDPGESHLRGDLGRPPEPSRLVYPDIIRVIATVAVILLHVSAAIVLSCRPGSGGWWVGNIVDSATRWAVPSFVMLSGALLLRPDIREPAFEFLRRRFSRILAPAAAWFFVYFWWLRFWHGQTLTLWDVVVAASAGGPYPYYHFYFLYVIAAMYLLTPWLRRNVSMSRERPALAWIGLFLTAGIINSLAFYATGAITDPQGPFPGFVRFPVFILSFAGYYLFGGLVAQHGSKRSHSTWLAVFIVSCALTALGAYALIVRFPGSPLWQYPYDYFSITTVPMALSSFALFRSLFQSPGFVLRHRTAYDRLAPHLSRLTFGTFLVHPILLDLVGRWLDVQARMAGSGSPVSAAAALLSTSGLVLFLSLVVVSGLSSLPLTRRII